MTSQLNETLESVPDSFTKQLQELFEDSVPEISDIMPSDWTEQNVTMDDPFPGPFRYSLTPYTREIIDCLSPKIAVHTIAVMKGAQIGFSNGVIYPGICWIIKNSPGNTYLSVGAPDLVEPAMGKIDGFIDKSGIRGLINSQAKRKKNTKTGDTNKKKEFARGFLLVGSANNHKNIRQIDLRYKFLDDLAAIKAQSKESGNTLKKLDSRSAAYADTKKTFLISTPELDHNSNIKAAYEMGDQRKFFIPCPCCKKFITLEWSVESQKTPGRMNGITWGYKENGQLDKESVGYTCQLCDEFFTDRDKMEWLNEGKWQATAIPKKEGYRSYHISALYAPIGMDGWDKYVQDWIDANPVGQPRKEDLWQVFVNECLGLTYSPPGTSVNSSQLTANIRKYEIGTIPEKQSIEDGNGRIVLLTCTADLGGRVAGVNSEYDDVRLDWEVSAWSESGSEYKIDQGSIGTFRPAHQEQTDDRERWSYDISKPNNVWVPFKKIISQPWQKDNGTKPMYINVTGIDTGFAEHQAFNFIDRCNFTVIGLKGDKDNKYTMFGDSSSNWKPGASRAKLYMLKVSKLKDQLAARINLRWDKYSKLPQPPGFINFPQPRDGKYSLEDYFKHYESEHRVVDDKGNYMWAKKSHNLQNHFWDVANYHGAVKEIIMDLVLEELKIKNGTWTDFCDWLLKTNAV